MSSAPKITIATISESHFAWGALLLVASLRKAGVAHRVNIFMADAKGDGSWEKCLAQCGDTHVDRLDMKSDPRSPALHKPEALLRSEGDYIAWFDSDCMAIGDIGPYLAPENGEFQIRLRQPAENGLVYKPYYAPGETPGPVPAAILAEWKKDVGENPDPRVTTQCVTNCFVLHQRHRWLFERWKKQIDKIFPPGRSVGVVDRSNRAYFMTDESVLSSVLAYGANIPPISDYRFDKDPKNYVGHFALRPKPWEKWQWRLWRYYDPVQEVLQWCRQQKINLPPLPPSFQRRRKLMYGLMAYTEHQLRATARKLRPKK